MRSARLSAFCTPIRIYSPLVVSSLPHAARVGIMQKFTYEKSLFVAHIINRGGMREGTSARARENDEGKNL